MNGKPIQILMKDLLKKHLMSERYYSRLRRSLQAERDMLEKKIREVKSPSRSDLLSKLGKLLCRHFPRVNSVEVMGPFGLGCHYGLSFKKGDKTLGYLTLAWHGDTLMWVSNELVEHYAPNTLGAINGLGRKQTPVASLTDKALAQLARKGFK